MLVYDNRERLRILLQIEGSVLWRTLMLGFLVGAASFGFAWWISRGDAESFWQPKIVDTWAANVVGTAISFAIVYRTMMAWSRYWEAANEVQVMFSKWSDSFSQLMSFITTAEKKIDKLPERTEELDDKLRALQKARRRLAHDFSLLSALGTHRLTHGDLGRMRRRSEKISEGNFLGNLFCCCCKMWKHWNDLIVYKQQLRYNDATNAFKMPMFKAIELHGRHTQVKARVQKHTMSAGRLGGLIANSPSSKDNRNKSVAVVLDQDDCNMVQMPSDHSPTTKENVVLLASNVTWSSDLVILGKISNEERLELDSGYDPADFSCTSPDRISLLVGWISEDINELVPIADTPPPIMSRCYQELSTGMLGFNQATKMADIPFPFPFSQLLELLLVCFTCLVPVYAANFTGGIFSSPFLAAVVTVAFWSLSEISRELETPFADGPNQLPVIDMHERFVEVIRSMYQTRRPVPPSKDLLVDKASSKGSSQNQPEDPPLDPTMTL